MKKVIISEKILTELNISDKNKSKYIGHGGYQYAFQSSDPDKVVKFGRNSLSDKEEVFDNKNVVTNFVKRKYNEDELYQFQEMKKYPQYFPIIYKITPNYILLEKLDNKKAKNQYLAILNIIKKDITYANTITFKDLLHEFREVGDVTKMGEGYLKVHRHIRQYFRDTNDYSLLIPYNGFMNLVKNITDLKLFDIDINAGNFGYDKKGNLKMLDV